MLGHKKFLHEGLCLPDCAGNVSSSGHPGRYGNQITIDLRRSDMPTRNKTKGEISCAEAKAILGISHQRLHQLIKKGALRATEHRRAGAIRSQWTVNRADVMERRQKALEHRDKSVEGFPTLGKAIAPEGYFTLRDVAELLDVTTETVRYWVRTGRLSSERLTPANPGYPRRAVICIPIAEVEKMTPSSQLIKRLTARPEPTYPDTTDPAVRSGLYDTLAKQEAEIERLEEQVNALREQITSVTADDLSSKMDAILDALKRPY